MASSSSPPAPHPAAGSPPPACVPQPRPPRSTLSTHCLSLLSSGSLRPRKSSIALLSLLPRGADQPDETWVTLEKGTGGRGGRMNEEKENHRGQSPEDKRGTWARV